MTASIFVSIAALVVSIGTAAWSGWYTHRSADRRELRAWKRTELLTSTAALLQLSTARHAVLDNAADVLADSQRGVAGSDPFDTEQSGGPHPRHAVDQMLGLLERIKLIDVSVAGVAEELVTAHLNAQLVADRSYDGSDPYRHVDAMMVAPAELGRLHAGLTAAYRAAIEST